MVFAIVATEKTSTKETPSARIGANNLQILHLRTFQFTRSSTNIKILISLYSLEMQYYAFYSFSSLITISHVKITWPYYKRQRMVSIGKLD